MRKYHRVIGVRVTEELYSMIGKISKARGEDTSDFVRRAILKELASLKLLSKEQEKALGLL